MHLILSLVNPVTRHQCKIIASTLPTKTSHHFKYQHISVSCTFAKLSCTMTYVRLCLLTMLVTVAAWQPTLDYKKGVIDVARCRASCVSEFVSSDTLTDAACSQSVNCDMCWQTCGNLFDNYFLWVDMCNDYIICMPGCVQACTFWDNVRSPGVPGDYPLSVSLVSDHHLFTLTWNRLHLNGEHVVYVLRAFDFIESKWTILTQTVNTSYTLQERYINEDLRYQLIVVSQAKILSVSDIHLDLLLLQSSGNVSSDAVNVTSLPVIAPAVSSVGWKIVLVLSCFIWLPPTLYAGVRRYRAGRASPALVVFAQPLPHPTCSFTDFSIDVTELTFGENIAEVNSGYIVTKGYFRSQPVYIKSVDVNEASLNLSHKLSLTIAKLSRVGRHAHFLSVAALIDNGSHKLLAVERMLQFTSLTQYLRSCYEGGETVDGTLYSFISCSQARMKTSITSTDLLNIIHQLSVTMEALTGLGYLHTQLTGDHVIIDPVSKEFKLVDPDIFKGVLCISRSCEPTYFMSPEALKGERCTFRSDVWSFGMLAWHILKLGEIPLSRFIESELYMWLCSAYRPPSPFNCSQLIYKLLLRCWSIFPEQRPSFSQISEQLSTFVLEADSHYRLACRGEDNSAQDDQPKSVYFKLIETSSLPVDDPQAWISPAALPVPPTKATARAFLPSMSRLNAVSEANIVAPAASGDDDVFEEDDWPMVDSPDEQALLSSDVSSRSMSRTGSRSVSRTGSTAMSRTGSRRKASFKY